MIKGNLTLFMTNTCECHVCKLVQPESFVIPQTSEPAHVIKRLSAF